MVDLPVDGPIPEVFRIGPVTYGNIYEKMPGEPRDGIAWLNRIGSGWSNPGERLMLAVAAPNADDQEDVECVCVCVHART